MPFNLSEQSLLNFRFSIWLCPSISFRSYHPGLAQPYISYCISFPAHAHNFHRLPEMDPFIRLILFFFIHVLMEPELSRDQCASYHKGDKGHREHKKDERDTHPAWHVWEWNRPMPLEDSSFLLGKWADGGDSPGNKEGKEASVRAWTVFSLMCPWNKQAVMFDKHSALVRRRLKI